VAAVWIVDSDGRLVYLNREAEELLGQDTVVCLGARCHGLVLGNCFGLVQQLDVPLVSFRRHKETPAPINRRARLGVVSTVPRVKHPLLSISRQQFQWVNRFTVPPDLKMKHGPPTIGRAHFRNAVSFGYLVAFFDQAFPIVPVSTQVFIVMF